jgi:DNA-binding NarL/FixJ family response regulator
MDTATPLPSDGASTRTPRVLVVDDEPRFRDAARRLLERRGYAVVAEASRAATALDAVERFAPQAVLLDVRLGDDDGFEVCRTLTRARPGLAVLLASTGDYADYADMVTSSGARGFVNKRSLFNTDFGEFWPTAGA